MPWSYLISDLNSEEIVEAFHEKELRKANKKEFRVEKVIKRKGDKLYEKATIVGLIKKISLYQMGYFPELYTLSKTKISV